MKAIPPNLGRITPCRPGADVPPDLLRVHRFEPSSRVNGPGLRAVLWVQGCALKCPGCFNPETHSFEAGEWWTIPQALEQIRAAIGIEGLTISGGEPLHQQRALTAFLREVRAQAGPSQAELSHTEFSVLVFSGYTWEEMHKFPRIQEFLDQVDVLIAGRYQASQRLAEGLIGSSNKTVHFLTSRYTPEDLAQVPRPKSCFRRMARSGSAASTRCGGKWPSPLKNSAPAPPSSIHPWRVSRTWRLNSGANCCSRAPSSPWKPMALPPRRR